MADKTSWTKPRTGMTYWDSIVGGARLAARTSDGSRGAPDAGLGIPGAVDALGVDLDPKAAIVRLDQQNSPPSSRLIVRPLWCGRRADLHSRLESAAAFSVLNPAVLNFGVVTIAITGR